MNLNLKSIKKKLEELLLANYLYIGFWFNTVTALNICIYNKTSTRNRLWEPYTCTIGFVKFSENGGHTHITQTDTQGWV